MQAPLATVPPALRAGIRQLMVLRGIAIAGQIGAIAAAAYLGVELPLTAMAFVVAALVGFNMLAWLRLRSPREASHAEIAAILAFDLTSFAVLIFLSGGTLNPFCLLFVLHAVLVALLLPPMWAAIGAAAIVACFVALARLHLPLALAGGEPLPARLLLLGHCMSFALTAGVTALFVTRIVAALREHDRMLGEATQRELRDDAVLRVGALAAGAAHELGTPLTTMAIVAAEIRRGTDSTSIQRDAGVLIEQIGICRETLANLMAAAGHARAASGGREHLDRFLDSIASRCRTLHPVAHIACDWSAIGPAPEIFAEQGLRQALLALLCNAADASPKEVLFSGRRDGDTLRLAIADRGDGFASADRDKAGRTFFTTKEPGKGAGLGLILASRAIERHGGSLGWRNREGGGTLAEVSLPMQSLSLEVRA